LRVSIEASLQKVQLELNAARKAMAEGRGVEAERERQMELKLQEEKEKRVADLHASALRRISRMDLSRGMNAWLEFHFERVRMLRLMRAVSSRLSRPQCTAAFQHWQRSWETEQATQAAMTQEQRFAAEIARHGAVESALQTELQTIKLDLIAARDSALAGQGKEAELKRLRDEELEKEREKRVAHLQDLGVRRLLQFNLARGWTAWLEGYRSILHMKRIMRASVARLSRPRMVAAFMHWHHDWDAEAAAAAAAAAARAKMSHEELLAAEVSKRAKVEERAHQLEIELRAARESMLAGHGKEAELKRRMEEQLEEEREKRIAHLHQVGLRRLFQKDLAKGWSSWRATYLDITYKRDLIREAIRRLSWPKLVAAFRQWQQERARTVEGAKRDMQASNEQQRAQDMATQEALHADLQRVRAEMDQQTELQRVALAEARQAATDALQRMAAERTAADEARRAAKEALENSQHANTRATHAHELLGEQQEKASAQLAKLLAEQREQLNNEIFRLTGEKDREIAILREKLEQLMAMAKKTPPPPVSVPDPTPSPTPAAKQHSGRFHLVYDPNKSVVDQLREQVQEKGLRTLDLFRELDEDKDGAINKKDWRKGMKKIADDDVPQTALDEAFDEADPDKSGTIEFKELEGFLKGRKQPAPRPSTPTRKTSMKAKVKPSLLAALASSMGVKPELIADAMDIVGSSEEDFDAMMKARAEAFGAADLDFDGKLDFNEYCTMVKARETATYTEAEFRAKFAALDIDGSGKIDQYEFITFSLRDALKRSKGRAIDIFRIWDDDASGYIDIDEFGKALVALGFCCSKSDIKSVFNLLDEDGSGNIEYKELSDILRKGAGSAIADKAEGPKAPKMPPGKPKAGGAAEPSPRAKRVSTTAKTAKK